MFLIGLTGGIASGKSTVARRLNEHGAIVLDADVFARAALEPGSPLLGEVAELFGADLVVEGILDRSALGKIVFQDEAARRTLEGLIHPYVRQEFHTALETIAAEQPHAVVVYDVPLLVEAPSDTAFDLVVVTHAGRQQQIDRLLNERNMSLEEATARIDAQASDEQRAERADVVIDTSGSLSHTMAQVDALWVDRVLPASNRQE